MYNTTIVSYDFTKNIKGLPSDLSSNLEFFNNDYDEVQLLDLPEYGDNSNYKDFESFDSLVSRFDPEKHTGQSFVCRVPDKYVWSSDSAKGGYDRISHVSKQKCKDNLNKKLDGSNEPKGFEDDDAGILSAYVRYEKKKDDSIKFALVKFMGNHRLYMKKLAHRGRPVELLMKVKFHDMNNNLSNKDFIRIEADAHHSDADDRNSQNESQKFHSGYLSGRKEFVDCYNYLLRNGLEYEYIMKLTKIKNSESFLTMQSIMGFNMGAGNGIFSKYGKENVDCAVKTMKTIANEIPETLGKDELITNTALWCFSLMFKTLTEQHSYRNSESVVITKSALFSKPELSIFFVEFFRAMKPSMFRKNQLQMCDLKQTTGVKSFAYICAEAFWKNGAITEYYRTHIKQNESHTHFTANHPAIQSMFIGKADALLQKQLISLLS